MFVRTIVDYSVYGTELTTSRHRTFRVVFLYTLFMHIMVLQKGVMQFYLFGGLK